MAILEAEKLRATLPAEAMNEYLSLIFIHIDPSAPGITYVKEAIAGHSVCPGKEITQQAGTLDSLQDASGLTWTWNWMLGEPVMVG